MKALFRELTADEVELVAGGENFIWAWASSGGGMPRSFWTGGGDWDWGSSNSDTRDPGPGTEYPTDFDWNQDNAVDDLANWLHQQIAANPDKTHEYGAYLYSLNGQVHSTALIKGTTDSVFIRLDANGNAVIDPATNKPIPLTFEEIGVPPGAVILGTVHSHPSMVEITVPGPNGGTYIEPATGDGWAPSDGDMRAMQNTAGSGNYVVDDYRMYISYGPGLIEFYHHDQNYNFIGSTPMATWAVSSSD